MKQARDEAEAEIAAFRAMKEQEFQAKQVEVSENKGWRKPDRLIGLEWKKERKKEREIVRENDREGEGEKERGGARKGKEYSKENNNTIKVLRG